MKKIICLVLVILFLFLSEFYTIACSSFAVYSDNKLYGMNFDYSDVKISYSISESHDIKVFYMNFEIMGKMSTTVGMNNKGLFVAMQAQFPEQQTVDRIKSNQIDMHDLGINMLSKAESVDEVQDFIKERMVVNHYLTSHNLYADKTGNAIVVEAGEKNNLISKIQDQFIVMTNFPNEKLKIKSYKEITEVGSDRYARAYEYISQNKDKFDIDNAFEVLKSTIQEYGAYQTQSSMIFDPDKGEIYIVVKRDFDRVWKVSLEKGTIETYRGFTYPVSSKLCNNGILMKDLLNYSIEDSKGHKVHLNFNSVGIFTYLLLSALVLFFAVLSIVIWRRNKYSKADNIHQKSR